MKKLAYDFGRELALRELGANQDGSMSSALLSGAAGGLLGAGVGALSAPSSNTILSRVFDNSYKDKERIERALAGGLTGAGGGILLDRVLKNIK